MAIPGAGEIVPGMNTQARKPAFEPKSDISPIPMQPAPTQTPKTIREYLQSLEAGQVPTFTNIPGGGAFAGQETPVAEFAAIAPGPGGGEMIPHPQAGQGAIPEGPAGDPADQPIIGSNPYDMAVQRLQHVLPDMEEAFAEKYGNTLSLQEHNEKFAEYVHVTANNLVKKYEAKVKEAETEGLKLLKTYDPASIKRYQQTRNISDLQEKWDWQKTYERALGDYEKMTDYDPIKQSMSSEDYARGRVEAVQKEINRRLEQDTAKDRAARGGSQELPPTHKEAEALFRKLLTAKRPDGTPATPDEAWEVMLGTYPEMKPFR